MQNKTIKKEDLRFLTLTQNSDEVVISIENSLEYLEIVKWTSDEWIEDPELVPTIFNAIHLFYYSPVLLIENLGFKVLESVGNEDFTYGIINELYDEFKNSVNDYDSIDVFVRLLLESPNSRELILEFIDEDRKDEFMMLDMSKAKSLIYNPVNLNSVRDFIEEHCFEVGEQETDIMMDNHKCIEFENKEYYMPEDKVFNNNENLIYWFLSDNNHK